MVREEKALLELNLKVYDAALDPSRWPEVLSQFSEFAGARGAMFFKMEIADSDRRLLPAQMSQNYNPKIAELYLHLHQQQELKDQDRFAQYSRMTDGIELISDRVLADTEDELRNRANTRMLQEIGIFHRAGALLNKDNVYRDRFAVQFGAEHGPLDSEDIRKTALVLPHIAKALNVSRPIEQLHNQFNAVLSYLDLLKVGVCFLNEAGVLMLKNLEFQRQMETYPVFRSGTNGKLLFNDPRTDSAVRRLMANISCHGHFGARPRKEAVTAVLDGEDYRLCIEVLPLHRCNELEARPILGHIVYSLDTSQPVSLNTAFLGQLFALTSTESEILSLIGEGWTNREISEHRSKSIETINTQTKSILSKTMTANRTQLIRLATNLSANFLTTPNAAKPPCPATPGGDRRANHLKSPKSN